MRKKSKYYNSENCRVCKMTHDWGYETVEECYIDGVEYFRCTDANSHIDIYVNANMTPMKKNLQKVNIILTMITLKEKYFSSFTIKIW